MPGDFKALQIPTNFAGPFHWSILTTETVSKFETHNQKEHRHL